MRELSLLARLSDTDPFFSTSLRFVYRLQVPKIHEFIFDHFNLRCDSPRVPKAASEELHVDTHVRAVLDDFAVDGSFGHLPNEKNLDNLQFKPVWCTRDRDHSSKLLLVSLVFCG